MLNGHDEHEFRGCDPVRQRRRSVARPPEVAVEMAIAYSFPMSSPLSAARRIIVKVGSALLVDPQSGRINRAWLETLIEDLLRLRKRGQQVILVSSGAIALGRRQLKLPKGALRLEESQAAAAVGQIRLAHAYKELLEEQGVTVAQVLLTLEDSERRRRYLNARATLEALLALGALPVINENDTVATAEIRYGDNDRLAARVAQMTGADCLVLLSDVEGLFTADPNKDPSAEFIDTVRHLTPQIEAMAGSSNSDLGSGGMATKMLAAKIAVAAGCHLCIAAGRPKHPVHRIEEGARCTWFVPTATPAAARKQWIAGTLRPTGSLMIDAGALRALQAGKSLLPAGVIQARGRFDRGDTVSVVGPDGTEIARGICAYSDADAARIMGRRSSEIESVLGFRGRDEMIHRDDLAIMKGHASLAVDASDPVQATP
jgi:glutamate 5-kinase